MNVPRLALLACLMVFLFFPALGLYLMVTHSMLEDPFASGAGFVWIGSVIVLLLLCAVYLRQEPDLVRCCLWWMGSVVILFFLIALSLPAIAG